MSYALTGPAIVTPGIGYVYTMSGWGSCSGTPVVGTLQLPSGWIFVSQTPVSGNTCTFTVIAGTAPGVVEVHNSRCNSPVGEGEPFDVGIQVSIGDAIKSNIGICCSQFAVACIDTSAWINNSSGPVTLTITFGNSVDAIAALGVASFTSTSNISLAACLANLVSQINAAALANASANPEGTSPASIVGAQLCITSWPTPNDATPCGDTTNYLNGFTITSFSDYVTMTPVNSTDFINGGTIINCIGTPSIGGSPFVCTGVQCSFTVTFPNGIPGVYTVVPPTGWTLVSVTVSGSGTLIVTLLPDSSSGVLMVTDNNGTTGYTTSFTLINDCFLADCASKMLLSQFCHDVDICCRDCDDYEKNKKQVQRNMYNKALALITMYSLAKQNYFLSCDPSDLPPILTLLNQIKGILIRCQICPEI